MPVDLSSARLKLERAEEHIANIHTEVRSFSDANPYRILPKRDPQTRQLHYYLSENPIVPAKISLIAGDAINSLRGSLDHLAFALFQASGGIGVAKSVYFPISEDATKFKSETPGKVQGIRKEFVDAINNIQPYGGGAGHQLWVLHKLNNIDKHRLLVTVASKHHSVNIGPMARKIMESQDISNLPDFVQKARIDWFKEFPNDPTLWIRPADPMCPLKKGDVLLTDAPDSEVNEKMQFSFEIAIHEPKIIDGQSVLPFLHDVAHRINDIISVFSKFT